MRQEQKDKLFEIIHRFPNKETGDKNIQMREASYLIDEIDQQRRDQREMYEKKIKILESAIKYKDDKIESLINKL